VAAAACPGLRTATGVCASPAPARVAGGRVTLPCAFFSSEVHSSSCSVAFSEGRSILNEVSRPIHRRRSEGLAVRGLFGLGVPELAVIAGVAALVFGPKQLPAIGKSLGQTVKSFQQATKEFEAEITKSKDETVAKVEGQQDESSPTESGTITSTPIATPPKSEKESM